LTAADATVSTDCAAGASVWRGPHRLAHVGRCSAKAVPSSPSRRRRRRRFPAPGRPPRPACPLGRGTGRYCPPSRWAREASAPLAASSWPGRARSRRWHARAASSPGSAILHCAVLW